MNKAQTEAQKEQLQDELETIKRLKQAYQKARKDCEEKIRELSMRKDLENLQSIIHQKRYQEILKKQLDQILDLLQKEEFSSIQEYLLKSYQNGYIGVMYDLHKQGIPIIIPINQEQVVNAVETDSKLSKGLYQRLDEDVGKLKQAVRVEVSRGIANGSSWNQVAEQIANGMNSPFAKAINRAITIARTEGHRIQQQSSLDSQYGAKEKGADIVKQWDSTLDGRTRPEHRKADGQIRELDEPFYVGGEKMQAPGIGGSAKNVCNCRCCLLQRARWALDEEELSTLKKRAVFFGLDKTNSFADFKKKYIQVSEQMKLSFPDDVYKINGFTESVKNEVDAAMEKLNNEYEIRLNSIIVEPAEKGDIFVIGYHDGVVDMVVNENADFDRIIARIKRKYNEGNFAGKSLEDYLAHEMAHCMLYQDCKTDIEFKAKYQQIESLYSSLKGISHYADRKKSGNEALAEAFVRVRNEEKVSPIVKVLVDTYFGRWKK